MNLPALHLLLRIVIGSGANIAAIRHNQNTVFPASLMNEETLTDIFICTDRCEILKELTVGYHVGIEILIGDFS